MTHTTALARYDDGSMRVVYGNALEARSVWIVPGMWFEMEDEEC